MPDTNAEPSHASDSRRGDEDHMQNMDIATAIRILQQLQSHGLNEAEADALRTIQRALPSPSSQNSPIADHDAAENSSHGTNRGSELSVLGQNISVSQQPLQKSTAAPIYDLLDLREGLGDVVLSSGDQEEVRLIQA